MVCLIVSLTCATDDEPLFVVTCNDRCPSWSPNNTQVAFWRGHDDSLQGIWLLDLSTANVDYLIEGHTPDWAPNCIDVVYTEHQYGDIWSINTETGVPKQIVDFMGMNPKWSPNGHHIICEKTMVDSFGIYLIDTTGAVRRLNSSALEPAWHPAGDRLIFLAEYDNQYGICTGDTNGTITSFIREVSGQAYPQYSPDGSLIVYYSREDRFIHVMDTLGNNDTAVEQGYDPSWTHDGNRIVYVYVDTTDYEICYSLWVMNADGSGKQRLTSPDD